MGNVSGVPPRQPIGIELQDKDELPRWSASAASSPKLRAGERPPLTFDRKSSDSGHLVLESERRRAQGESQRVSRLSGQQRKENDSSSYGAQAPTKHASPLAKDARGQDPQRSRFGPLGEDFATPASVQAADAVGKSLSAPKSQLMDSLDSAFEANPASSAKARSSSATASEEADAQISEAGSDSSSGRAMQPEEAGSTGPLQVSTLVSEPADSLEPLEATEPAQPQEHSELEEPEDPVECSRPMPSAGSIATALAFVSDDGISGQGSLELSSLPFGADPSCLELMLPDISPTSPLDVAPESTHAEPVDAQTPESVLGGKSDGADESLGVCAAAHEREDPRSGQVAPDQSVEAERKAEEVQGHAGRSSVTAAAPADTEAVGATGTEGVENLMTEEARLWLDGKNDQLDAKVTDDAEAAEVIAAPEEPPASSCHAPEQIPNAAADSLPAHDRAGASTNDLRPSGTADADSTVAVAPEEAELRSGNGTAASSPDADSNADASNEESGEPTESEDTPNLGASVVSPSPSQRSLQHSIALPTPKRQPASLDAVEADFFVRLVNHRLQGDEQLAGVLPVSVEPGCLEEACRDGVLLCKLLNSLSPDAIDERVINQSRSCSPEKLTSPVRMALTQSSTDGVAQDPVAAAQPSDRDPPEPAQQPAGDDCREPAASLDEDTASWPNRVFGTPASSPDAKHQSAGNGFVACLSGGPLSWQQQQENNSLCLNAARALGCSLADVTARQLMDGQRSAVMACIREFVNLSILQELTVVRHPELMVLQNLDEDTQGVMEATPAQLMALWVNHHLAAQASGWQGGELTNLGEDLRDGSAFCHLLERLQPDSGIVAETRDLHPWYRAEEALALAEEIAGSPLPSAPAIADGHEQLNLLTLALLFRARHGLDAVLADAKEQLAVFGKWLEEYDWADSREERTFRVWISSLTSELGARQSLVEGLKDGFVLLRLLDAMAPGVVDWRRVHQPPFRPLRLRPHSVENCNQVMRIAREMLQLPLVNIGGEDIVNGQRKLLLAILRQLMRFHIRHMLQRVTSRGNAISDAELDREVLAWANAQVEGSGKKRRLKSFNDRTLANGLFLVELLAAIDPSCVNAALVTSGATDHDKEMNAKYVVSTAKKLGCVVYTVWEDIVEVNSSMILVFVASLQLLMLNKQPS